MQVENLTASQKLLYLIQNKQKIPTIYHPFLYELKKNFESNKYSACELIKIQTFYHITQPALMSLFWESPHQQVSYPVAVIPCSKSQNGQGYSISYKFVGWVQSGGIRCICLKTNASDSEIQKFIKMSHCAIFYLSEQTNQDESYNQFIQKFIQKAREEFYPILFIGKSAALGLEIMTKLPTRVHQITQNYSSDIFIDLDSGIMAGLELTVRLQVQNCKKISVPNIKLFNTGQLGQMNGYRVTGRMKYKNQKQIVSVIENKERKMYFIFNDTFSSEISESIQFWHCAIANFVDIAKSRVKQVDEKLVQKHLIANNKIMYRGQKGYYQTK